MKSLHLQPNEHRTGFKTNSEYTKARLADWLKKYDSFEVKPVVKDSKKGRRYLEGAVIPDYCAWQYGIDPREKGKGEARRFLFKRDFHSEIVENREGEPVRAPLSSRGEVRDILDRYTEWAEANGAPVPNPELFKLYRDKYSMDPRWDCFHDWLDFLGIASDSMPSAETFKALEE